MEVKFNMIEHYSACRFVKNFICSLQNEKGLLDKIPPKSQGCIYSFRGGILWCLHTFFQFGTCGFKNRMKYLCIVQTALLSYYWIPVLVQGLNQNYTKSESQDAKWTLENNPILFKKSWSFSVRLDKILNSVHFQRDCPFVWICCIRRGTNAWQHVLWEQQKHILAGLLYILKSTLQGRAGRKDHPADFSFSQCGYLLTDEEPHSARCKILFNEGMLTLVFPWELKTLTISHVMFSAVEDRL